MNTCGGLTVLAGWTIGSVALVSTASRPWDGLRLTAA